MKMHILILIISKFESIMGLDSSTNKSSQNFLNIKKDTINNDDLNQDVIAEFHLSLNTLSKTNKNLIKNIKNLKFAHKYENFCKYSLPSFCELIHVIAGLRKDSEENHPCVYECIKFYELFYQTLFYIMKHKNELLTTFYQFTKKQILPILYEINLLSCFYQIDCKLDIFSSKLRIKKKQKQHHEWHSFIIFCIEFSERYDKELSVEKIFDNYDQKDLPKLCLNIFIRVYLVSRGKSNIFLNDFRAQKYPIMRSFEAILFKNGYLTSMSINARLLMTNFMRKHNLNIEEQLISANILPSAFDMINKHASRLNLTLIQIE